MELWTRQEHELTWRQWPDILSGLASVLGGFRGEVLILSEAPDLERGQVASVVGIIRQFASGRAGIVVATPHPTKEWIDALDPLGVDRFWVVNGRGADRETPPCGTVNAIEAQICPALHAITREKTTLSVCGCRGDRLVRVWPHLTAWCLGEYQRCPHWLRAGHA